jgi:hypothetical protein
LGFEKSMEKKNWIHSPGALGAFRYQSSFIRNRRPRRTRHPLTATRYFPDIWVALSLRAW